MCIHTHDIDNTRFRTAIQYSITSNLGVCIVKFTP